MKGAYVYGVAREGALTDMAYLSPGIRDGQVSLVTASGLSAMISDPGAEEVEPTRRLMLGHTALLERAMGVATILPMRFGTIAPDDATLARCLTANATTFGRALDQLDGKVELGLKASWKEGVIYREILETDATLRSLRDRLQKRSTSETYYERIELGRRVEAMVAARREAEASAILAPLAPLVDTEAELKNLGDGMILNRAFLVSREAEHAFDRTMEQLAERHVDRIEFRYVGPVPPYHFVQIRTDWLG